MKKFPPRRRLWPAAALLCLLALPLLLALSLIHI